MKRLFFLGLVSVLSVAALAKPKCTQDTLLSQDMLCALDNFMDKNVLYGTADFQDLNLDSGDTLSLTAADSLTRALPEEYASRGQTADGSVYTKTCAVKAGGSVQYSFHSKGHQELAVAAESGGRVTLKIHVTNSAGLDRRYDDTQDVKLGRPYRKVSFELPQKQTNTVTLTVINCSGRDIRFVVMSN